MSYIWRAVNFWRTVDTCGRSSTIHRRRLGAVSLNREMIASLFLTVLELALSKALRCLSYVWSSNVIGWTLVGHSWLNRLIRFFLDGGGVNSRPVWSARGWRRRFLNLVFSAFSQELWNEKIVIEDTYVEDIEILSQHMLISPPPTTHTHHRTLSSFLTWVNPADIKLLKQRINQ